jgi:hypothetical protein
MAYLMADGPTVLSPTHRVVNLLATPGRGNRIQTELTAAPNDCSRARAGVAYSLVVSEMNFEIIGNITDVETIAVGTSIRELARLRRAYGSGRWRKLKGVATVRLADESVCKAEVHWYEAHGKGRTEMKIKRLLD